MSNAKPVLSRRAINLILVSLIASLFMSSLNQTVIGTAMRTIADDLGGLSMQAWATTAFLVASTVATPIYGKLSDVFGRRPLLLAAMITFLVGSLLASTAADMIQLSSYRGVQGLGAGGLMSLPLAVLADVLTPKERAKIQGLFMAVFGISSVAGPLVGGLFAGIDTLFGIRGWRWVFLISVPLTAIAFTLAWRYLRLPTQRGTARIDWWGTALVIPIVVPLILVAEQGAYWGWTSLPAIACYLIVLSAIVAFIAVEQWMGDDAIIPMSLFRRPVFSITVGLSVLIGFGMFSLMVTLPLYLQVVLRLDPTTSGMTLLPQVFSQLLASMVTGFVIARIGRTKPLLVGGSALLLIAFWFFATASYGDPLWRLYLPMVLFGVALGALLQSLTFTLQSAVDPTQLGVATSASAFFRSIGGTFGTGIAFSMLFGSLVTTVPAAFRNDAIRTPLRAATSDPQVVTDPANTRILELINGPIADAARAMNGDTSFLIGTDERLAAPFLWAFNESMTLAYWFGFAMVAAALALSLFLPNTRLGTKSGLEQLRDRGELTAPVTSGDAPTGQIPIIRPRDDSRQPPRPGSSPGTQQPPEQ